MKKSKAKRMRRKRKSKRRYRGKTGEKKETGKIEHALNQTDFLVTDL